MSLSDTLRDILNARARRSFMDVIPSIYQPVNPTSDVNEIDDGTPQEAFSETESKVTCSYSTEFAAPQETKDRALESILEEEEEEMEIKTLNQSATIWTRSPDDSIENYYLIRFPPIKTSTPKKKPNKRSQEDLEPELVTNKKHKLGVIDTAIILTKSKVIVPPEIIKQPKQPGYLRDTKASKAKRVTEKPYSRPCLKTK